ncbi:MAG: hypothetical protein ACLT38_07345 [Akkermansia sp.]
MNEDFRIKLPRWRVNVLFTPADATGSKNRKNNGIFPAGHPFSGQTGSNPALTAAT